jgi:hypothetical protein
MKHSAQIRFAAPPASWRSRLGVPHYQHSSIRFTSLSLYGLAARRRATIEQPETAPARVT